MLEGLEVVGALAEAMIGLISLMCEGLVLAIEGLSALVTLVAELLVLLFSSQMAAKMRERRHGKAERRKARRAEVIARFRQRRKRRIQRVVQWVFGVLLVGAAVWLYFAVQPSRTKPVAASAPIERAAREPEPGNGKSRWSIRLEFWKKGKADK